MTRKAIEKHKAVTKLPSSETDYEVGYGKSPVSSRFKKGKPGNPKVRPKGAKGRLPDLNEERLKSIIIKEAYRSIDVVEGGKTVTYPMAQAVMRGSLSTPPKANPERKRYLRAFLRQPKSQITRCTLNTLTQ